MKEIILKILLFFQIHRITRSLFLRKKNIILMYHGFTDKQKLMGIENFGDKHINSNLFRDQIEYLKKYYTVISLAELVRCYKDRTKIPEKAVVITIDDGYRSNCAIAYPMLKEYNVPATIFITTDFVDKVSFLWVDRLEYAIDRSAHEKLTVDIRGNTVEYGLQDTQSKIIACRAIKDRLKSIAEDEREKMVFSIEKKLGAKLNETTAPGIYQPLRWHEILKMSANGPISVGSHTCTHPILTRCDRARIENEIFLSKKILEEKTGLECDHFCYPNGKKGDFNKITKESLKKAGFSSALTTVTGMNDSSSDVFSLKRAYIRNGMNHTEFMMTLSGVIRVFEVIRRIMSRLFFK